MITVTVQPSTPDQFAAVGRLLADYSKALPAEVSAADQEQETPAPAAVPARRTRKPAAPVAAAVPDEAPADEPAEEAPAPAAPVTLEQVRARLAELSQAGKTAAIKALLSKFGAAKLTDIPADKFGAVLAEAEAL